ncbi:MAG: GNAT family protein [Chloroflexota bacterium]
MFNPAYRIVTPRTIIRCYNPTDAFLLANSISESLDHLLPWMPFAAAEPEPFISKIERLRRMRSNFDINIDYAYGIFNQESTKLIGSTGLHPRVGPGAIEIGYWIHKDFINQGFATEATSALTKVAFEINQVERIEIHCSVENLRSATIPRKLGYSHEANLRKRSFANGVSSDQMVWSLFAEDYPASPSKNILLAAYDAAERRLI